jgi:hypothetical protein
MGLLNPISISGGLDNQLVVIVTTQVGKHLEHIWMRYGFEKVENLR